MRNSIKKTKNRKKIIITSLLVIALLAPAVYYLIYNTQQEDDQGEVVTPKSELSDPTLHKGDSETIYDGKTTDQIPENTDITVTITSLQQHDDMVTFSATTTSTAADGKCVITFTNPNDRPISRTIDAAVGQNNSQCGPISIPAHEFSFIGDWTATIRYYSNETQAVASKVISIK